MFITRSLQALYAKTIDRSKFREIASRVVVFVLPLFFWGKPLYWWGLVFIILGLGVRAWGAGFLDKDKNLASGGPYLFFRHPLYLGSCLLSLGMIVILHSWWVAIIIGGITALIYQHTIRHEEENLVQRFGEKYKEHQKRTGIFIPKLAGLKQFGQLFNPASPKFSFSLYRKNKEWECLLGVLVVIVFLYFGSPK